QVFGVHRRQGCGEGGAVRLDVRPVALFGMEGFLLAADAVLAQDPSDRRDVTRDAQAVAQFREGSVGLFPDEFQESPEGGGCEFGGGAATVGLGLDRAGGAASLQEPDEEGQAHGEQVGNLAQRVFAAIKGRDDPFPEIVGIRTHGGTSFGAAPPSHSIPYVTRVRTALGAAPANSCCPPPGPRVPWRTRGWGRSPGGAARLPLWFQRRPHPEPRRRFQPASHRVEASLLS